MEYAKSRSKKLLFLIIRTNPGSIASLSSCELRLGGVEGLLGK